MSNQKLYILQPRNSWYSPYDKAWGFVVSAGSPLRARKLASQEAGDEGEEAWLDKKLTTCKELKPSYTDEVIMRDFNAG